MLKSILKLLVCANILVMGHGAYADFCAEQHQACKNASSSSSWSICDANHGYCQSSTSTSGNKWQIPIWPNCQATSAAACTPSYQLNQELVSLLGGSFGSTCKECTFGANGGPTLSCRCHDGAGRHADTTLDVSTCTSSQTDISNCSATLTCGACPKELNSKRSKHKTVSTKKK